MLRVERSHEFMRVHAVDPKITSVPPDMITPQVLPGDPANKFTLTVDEGLTIRLNEIWTEFALTPQQVHDTAEAKHPQYTTGVILARRAAQYLALAKNMVIFQGSNAYNSPFLLKTFDGDKGRLPYIRDY